MYFHSNNSQLSNFIHFTSAILWIRCTCLYSSNLMIMFFDTLITLDVFKVSNFQEDNLYLLLMALSAQKHFGRVLKKSLDYIFFLFSLIPNQMRIDSISASRWRVNFLFLISFDKCLCVLHGVINSSEFMFLTSPV